MIGCWPARNCSRCLSLHLGTVLEVDGDTHGRDDEDDARHGRQNLRGQRGDPLREQDMQLRSERERKVNFVADQLRALMQLTDREWAAERANLCLEERVTPERQATYEVRVGRSADWSHWEDAHRRYVVEDVRRRHPLSAAFDGGDALRPNP